MKLNKVLGVALGQASLTVAEVATRGERPAVERVAELVYPEGAGPENPAALGQALRKFLRANGFTTRDAVLGLPAKWLVTRRKDVPPGAPAMVASTLRLQAEGEFENLVLDYCGQTSRTEATAVLLIATGPKHIEGCVALAAAAGLRLRGISATAAALGRVTRQLTGGPGLVLSVSGGGAELMVNLAQSPEQLRYMPVNDVGAEKAESLGMLVGEIRRTLAALPREGAPATLALWHDGVDAGLGKVLAERLGLAVTTPSFNGLAGGVDTDGAGPAAALALSALDPAGLPVDFLHSRLAAPKVKTNRRPMALAISAAAALVLVIVAGVVDLHVKESQLAKLRADSVAQIKAVAEAQNAYDRLAEARRWTNHKPRFVACLRELTGLFPDEGTIWATSLKLSATNQGSLAGKAAGEQQVRAFKDRMLGSKQFLDVMCDIHESARTSSGAVETSFTISFTYRAAE